MAADKTTTPSGRTVTELHELADSLRSRVDLFGKTLAAVATLGTTAVGLNKIGDLFPAASDKWWVIAGACLGLAISALAAIEVAVRLMRVGRPIFMRADLARVDDLSPRERKAVEPVFEAAANRFGYTSLVGLQERERSLRNAASRATDEDERARRTALADDVKTEIDQALARGLVVAVRRRSADAVSRPWAWVMYGLVIVGLIVFALGADNVSSDRRDKIADAKACGEARKAAATPAELERTKICDTGAAKNAEEKPKPPSVAEARAQLATQLAKTQEACAALVQKPGDTSSGPLTSEDCNAVREARARIDPATP